MFDKKSEYALNKHDQDSIIYTKKRFPLRIIKQMGASTPAYTSTTFPTSSSSQAYWQQ